MTSAVDRRRERSVEVAAVLLVASVATYLLFTPVFDDWFGQVIVGPGFLKADTYLMLWILSWGSHAVLTQPLDFFQANILHPAPSTLAGAEHMAGYLPLFAPAYWATDNAAFAFQVTLFLSFALSGVGMYALLRHWGCSRWGAAFGGILMILAPGKFNRAFVVQSIGWFYLPFVLIYFDRVLERGRVRDAAAVSILFALQMLCSFYLAYISLAIFGAYCAVVLPWRVFVRRDVGWRNLMIAVGSIGLAGIVLVVFALPYVARASSGEIPDQAGAGLKTFSMVQSWQAYARSPRYGKIFGASYYLGILPMVAAVYALLPRREDGRWRGSARVYGLLAAAAVTFVMAAGPPATFEDFQLPPLYDLFLLLPGFSSVRGANRFALGLNFAVMALAGIGMSRLLRSHVRPRWAAALVLAVAVGATYFDFGHAGFRHLVLQVPTGDDVPPVYRELAKLPGGVVLELPGGSDMGFRQLVSESEYGYFSTVHWNPLLNGYTGYQPQSSLDVFNVAKALPDRKALRLLARMTGLRYVVVHLGGMPEDAGRTWVAPPGLTLLQRYGEDLLFEVAAQEPPDLQGALLARQPAGRTLGGAPIALVPEDERRASIGFAEPRWSKGFSGLLKTFGVTVRNDSNAVWPGLAPGSDDVVQWAVRWDRLDGGVLTEDAYVAPLPYDLAPGDEIRTLITVRPPKALGEYRLEIGLAQGGEWFPAPAVLEPFPLESLQAIRALRRQKAN